MDCRKHIFGFSFCCCLLASWFSAKCQDRREVEITETPDISYVNLIRPKILEISYAKLGDFSLQSRSGIFGDSERVEVRNNYRLKFKLNFPIVLRSDLIVGGSFVYKHEQFNFEDPDGLTYDLYNNLENRSLRSSGLRLFMNKNLPRDRYFKALFGLNLNGDEYNFADFSNYLKTNFTVIYGKKLNSKTELGVGLSFGYDLGRKMVIPLIEYRKIFNRHWMLETALPKSVKMTYAPSRKTRWIGEVKITGASYHLSQPVFDELRNADFRYSVIKSGLKMEKEIYDFLWFSVDGGYMQNIRWDVREMRKYGGDRLIEGDPFGAFYVNFSLFVVPPYKLFYKAVKK